MYVFVWVYGTVRGAVIMTCGGQSNEACIENGRGTWYALCCVQLRKGPFLGRVMLQKGISSGLWTTDGVGLAAII